MEKILNYIKKSLFTTSLLVALISCKKDVLNNTNKATLTDATQ